MLQYGDIQKFAAKLLNKKVIISVGSIVALVLINKAYKKRQRELKRQSYPRDVVILHQFPRCLTLPSLSPYVLKLETWLRMANIKYQNEYGMEAGSKGKVPFITYNGEDVPDSDFIIQFLSKKLDKDLNKEFSPSDQGIARAFSKLVEESIVWVVALQRYVYAPEPDLIGIPSFIMRFIKGRVKERSKAQGYGLHSQDEIYSIGRKDLKSINDFLGGKAFLLGDKPCNEDAALFGMLCQILYAERGPTNQYLKNECPNIVAYLDKIKSVYWPDWNSCLSKEPWKF